MSSLAEVDNGGSCRWGLAGFGRYGRDLRYGCISEVWSDWARRVLAGRETQGLGAESKMNERKKAKGGRMSQSSVYLNLKELLISCLD